MNEKLSNMLYKTGYFVRKHSPEILVGLGITGMLSSMVLAVKATPKALSLIDDQKLRLGEEKLTPIETIKVAWKSYVPSGILSILSISCIIGATNINLRRNAALATAYTISERTLVNYKNKVIDAIGEKKEKKIQEELAQDKVDKNKINDNQVIITSNGETLCMDSLSGRYFKSDIETIRKAVNDLNRQLTFQHYISLNEFYDELGLKHIKNGSYMGWNLDDGLIEVYFNTALADNGQPCIVMEYDISPRYGFDKLM